MLKRIHIKGFKSLVDVEVELKPLILLIGPNAAGKSNFLDALAMLAKLGSGRTIKEAFDPPSRGKPLECFSFGEGGLRGLLEQQSLTFSMEADLHLSDSIVDQVNRQVRTMRPSNGSKGRKGGNQADCPVHHRDLRYRVEIEMLPKAGVLRVADEYLAPLTRQGQPNSRRKAFIECVDDRLRLRPEGQAHPTYHERHVDQTVLSMPHFPPHHPHVVAARVELENWLFYSFEPRERMRAPGPVREVLRLGAMGEELAAFLNTLKAHSPKQYQAIEKALAMLVPNVDGIEVGVNNLGEVELDLRERGVAVSSRVTSDGTLRLLGLLAFSGMDTKPALIGLEEPENGVHPRRMSLIAELLNGQAAYGDTQYVVTSHSPLLPDHVDHEALYVAASEGRRTRIDPFTTWGPIARRADIDRALDDAEPCGLPISERILRGDMG